MKRYQVVLLLLLLVLWLLYLVVNGWQSLGQLLVQTLTELADRRPSLSSTWCGSKCVVMHLATELVLRGVLGSHWFGK
jgi:hypothetical protein